jgi:hypothetical protein
MSITQMRAEMRTVPQYLFDFDWCLRYTTDPSKPIVTADEAIRFEGSVPLDQADVHFQTRLYLPLSWQACLIGSPGQMMPKTRIFSSARLMELHNKYLSNTWISDGGPNRYEGPDSATHT